MAEASAEQITRLLADWSQGDEHALAAVTPLIYEELRRLARKHMRGERANHTLQSTALVHEAYVRLLGQNVEWKSRTHFYAIAAKMMRRILMDHAKKHKASKRGSGVAAQSLDEPALVAQESTKELIALDDALTTLAKIDPQRSEIVELRYFGGLSNEESAEVLGISPATVQRQWAGAKVWLYNEMSDSDKKGL